MNRTAAALIVLGIVVIPVVLDQHTERESCFERQETRRVQIVGLERIIESAQFLKDHETTPQLRDFWRREWEERKVRRADADYLDCPAIPLLK